MRKLYSIILSVAIVSLLGACSDYEECYQYPYDVVVKYCNDTYCPIKIEFTSNPYWELGVDFDHGVVTVSPGKSIMLGSACVIEPVLLSETDIIQDRELDFYAGIYAFPRVSKVTFAPNYVLSGKDTKLGHTSSYQIEYNAFSNEWTYTYTFTDEDYAYAREHGEVVE